MTKEQLEHGNAIVKRIDHLQKILDVFMHKAATMDESLVRMTGFSIVGDHAFGFNESINQGELLFLIEAFTNEIHRLEHELSTI